MAELNWTDEAIRHAADLMRMNPKPVRGVHRSSFPGVSMMFAPAAEQKRVEGLLADAGIEVLGIGKSHSLADWASTFAMFVRSTDTPTLESIVKPQA